jgi:hypothetical protein
MSPRSNLENALRVLAGGTAACLPAAAALLLLTRGLPSAEAASISPARAEDQRILAAAPEDAAAIERALHLLPRRPEKVAIIDPDDATPEGQKILEKSDAFITKGGRIVYINRHSEVLKGARQCAAIYICMLAAIIWHEMAHIDGADEEGAQRREEGLWKRFLVEGRVDRVTALRYLKLMNERHSGS